MKLGFVGCGFMGQMAHLINYAELPDVQLTALADGKSKTAAEVAKRYSVGRVYPDHRSLLADADVDAIVAILPFGLHNAVVPDILKAGKHCLTEKPIGQNPKNGRSTADLATENNVIYHVGYMKRCDPAAIYAKELIAHWRRETQEFGQIRHLRVSMPPGDWIYGMERPISFDEEANYENQALEPTPDWMDGHTTKAYLSFVNYYIHQVNLIRYLLGEDYSVRYADSSGVLLIAESASGVPISLEMATHNLRDEWKEDYVAGFENGQIRLELPAPLARQPGRIHVYRNTTDYPIYENPIMPPTWSMKEQARIFIETIRNGSVCISSADDAVKDLEVAEDYIRLRMGATI